MTRTILTEAQWATWDGDTMPGESIRTWATAGDTIPTATDMEVTMGPYTYAGTGFGGYGGYGMNNGWGTGWYDVSNVVVAPRTPIWTSSAINSNGTGGGRLLTNKVDVDTGIWVATCRCQTIWRGFDSVIQERHEQHRRRHRLRIRPGIRGSTWSNSTQPLNQTRSTTSSSRTNSTRNTNWSGSSSRSSGGSREARRNRALLPTAVHPEAALAGAPAEVEEAQGEAAVNLPPKS